MTAAVAAWKDSTERGRLFVSKAGPLTLISIGVIGAALAVGWSILVWHFDELISPRGQVTVTVTTACVMFFFLGTLAYWRATDKERNAGLREVIESIPGLIAGARAEVRSEMGRHAADLATDYARREMRLLEQVETLQDRVAQLSVSLDEVTRLCRPKPGNRRNRRKPEAVPKQAGPEGEPADWALNMAAEAFRLGQKLGPPDASGTVGPV